MKDLLNTPLKDLSQAELQQAFILREQQLAEIDKANEEYRLKNIGGVHVIADTMEQIKCMANGKHYDSKKKYRDELKAQDCHVVEKGEIHSDMNYKRELVGDFDVTGDLKHAVQKHLR